MAEALGIRKQIDDSYMPENGAKTQDYAQMRGKNLAVAIMTELPQTALARSHLYTIRPRVAMLSRAVMSSNMSIRP